MTEPTAAADLTLFLGQRVIVTGPNGARWAGILTALADQPTAVIDLADGGRVSLPQSHTYTVVPRPEDELREQLAAATARAERAEAALAVLHQGEEPHLDERIVPTPAQWIWRWNRATLAERLDVAGRVIHGGTTADRCFLENHPARLADLQQRYDDEHATAVTRARETEQVRRQLAAAERRIVALQAECDGLAESGRNETRIWSDQITAVRAEHARDDSNPLGPWCGTCLRKWPCATITALDGPADTPAAPCDHQDPKRLGARPGDLAVFCACGTQVMAGLRTPRQTEQEKSFMADIQATFVEPFARAEAAQREAKIAAALAASFTVVRTDPVEQVAAEVSTVARLKAEFAAAPEGEYPANWGPLTLQGNYGAFLPVVTDGALPVGEVHLRPHPRPTS